MIARKNTIDGASPEHKLSGRVRVTIAQFDRRAWVACIEREAAGHGVRMDDIDTESPVSWDNVRGPSPDDTKAAVVAGITEFARAGDVTVNLDGKQIATSMIRYAMTETRLSPSLIGGY